MFDNIGVRPLSDKIIVKRIDERTTEGGIVIPETIGEKSQRGTVVAVGPAKYENGKLQKLSLKCNDNVIFFFFFGSEIDINVKNCIVMKEEDVVAIID